MNASLELAKRLSETVNAAWESGELLEQVTPTTQELLKFWFSEEYCSLRNRNFHIGQRQAILNVVYLHEVMGVKNVMEYYEQLTPDLMPVVELATLGQKKYQMPKYAVKMATGTGKTWVMHALLLWQMLNARHEDVKSGRFTKNFLIVAPGLIVYDRLLEDMEMRVMLQLLPHNPAVKQLVSLGSRCPDGRSLGGVERPELDAGSVSNGSDETAHCIDFPYKVPLADASDCRVA